MSTIYPSAFNHCVLTCWLEAGRETCTLYFENTMDTWYVQLQMPKYLFLESGSRFRCDALDAHDGGTKYLTVCDANLLRGEDISGHSLENRRRLLHEALFESSTSHDTLRAGDEFRLVPARTFDFSQIIDVETFHVPNHPGICYGAAFLNDDFNPHVAGAVEGMYVVRKSRYPDVYELYEDGVHPVPGNNIAYVPTLSMSRRLREVFKSRNSISLSCAYNPQRQKWVPQIDER